MAIKALSSNGKIVMKSGKLACSCCGGNCTSCALDVAASYNLTGQPYAVDLLQVSPCAWEWYGDMAVSGDYDAGGPDYIYLSCYTEVSPAAWALGFVGPNVGFVIITGPDDSAYPTGDYGGNTVT